jgi:signal transduction histidine kinase
MRFSPQFTSVTRAAFHALWLLALLSSALAARAENADARIALDPETGRYEAGTQLYILEDPDRILTLEQARRADAAGQFVPGTTAAPSYGFSSSAYWLRLSVRNTRSQAVDWRLQVAFPTLQWIDLWTLRGALPTIEHQQAGLALPLSERPLKHRTHVFPVMLAAGEEATLYLRISGDSSKTFPVTLWTPEALESATLQDTYVFGAFAGVMLGLALYNLLIWAIIRDTTYGLAALTLVSLFGIYLTLTGTGRWLLWPDAGHWTLKLIPVSIMLAIFCGSHFFAAFLDIKRQWPRSLPLIHAGNAILLVLLLTCAFAPFRAIMIALVTLTITTSAVAFLVAIAAAVNRQPAARYFLISWCALLVGMVLQSVRAAGMIPDNFFTQYSLYIGSALQGILLSVALAARVRALKEDTDRAQRQMMQHEKLANIGLLSAGIAHEINNPNNFIGVSAQTLESRLKDFRSFIQGLLEDDADDEMKSEFARRFDGLFSQLHLVQEGSHRISDIVKGMRSQSRQDGGERTRFDPAQSLKSTLELVKPSYRLVAVFDDAQLQSHGEVLGHASQINQVFTNLLVNACHAVEEKQKQSGSSLPGVIRLESHRTGDKLRIAIADNGVGMTPDIMKHLFDPFFTTKDAERGTGLGMSICRRIIESHNGRIEVESTPGTGTRMTVVLPIVGA